MPVLLAAHSVNHPYDHTSISRRGDTEAVALPARRWERRDEVRWPRYDMSWMSYEIS
jgi:hypothetical protein